MIADMKRVFPMIAMIALLIFMPQPQRAKAKAEEEPLYAVVAAEQVWFYEEADESTGLFYLPYTYCVKVLEEGSFFCRVQYGGADGLPALTGYCRKETLVSIDYAPEHPFLIQSVSLVYRLENPSAAGGNGSDVIERTALLYGYAPINSIYHWYVSLDGANFYVSEKSAPVYALTDYLPSAEPEPPPVTAEEETGGISAVQIVVICVASAAAVAVAVFVARGKKTGQTAEERSDF